MFMQYKHAIQLYKIFNLKELPLDWILLNFDQSVSQRQTKFKILQNQNYKIGNNILSNRLCVVNGRIELDWLNLSLPSFKIKCKRLFLQWHKKTLMAVSGILTMKWKQSLYK